MCAIKTSNIETSANLIACERLNRSKSYFLAQAVHDLRQPLQAQRIYLQVLKDTTLTLHQQDLVDKASQALEDMQHLMDNYLDLSRLDYGGVKFEPDYFKLQDLTDKLAAEFSAIANAQGFRFSYIRCTLTIFTDKILLERMLRNLLSNAFKYGRSKVVFGCKRRGEGIQIIVLDNGNGINQEDIPYIFDEFYQSAHLLPQHKSGSGLGLSIVKKIADILHTSINIKTEKGKGTSFSFMLYNN